MARSPRSMARLASVGAFARRASSLASPKLWARRAKDASSCFIKGWAALSLVSNETHEGIATVSKGTSVTRTTLGRSFTAARRASAQATKAAGAKGSFLATSVSARQCTAAYPPPPLRSSSWPKRSSRRSRASRCSLGAKPKRGPSSTARTFSNGTASRKAERSKPPPNLAMARAFVLFLVTVSTARTSSTVTPFARTCRMSVSYVVASSAAQRTVIGFAPPRNEANCSTSKYAETSSTRLRRGTPRLASS
mmetsp:Transcript_28047/g.90417  ORF Transcript_28047/g.90417 Transcript_28047/m.90417 type:complete len:251 (-) Transcript_28047:987-1739(-)